MSKDPYMLKAQWLIEAKAEDVLTFFRDRIVYGKSMGLPVDEARGENPEDFLIWVYQREDETFKKKFTAALGKLLSELFEQVRQGHKDRLDALSGVLHIILKNQVPGVTKILQENLIDAGRLSSFALSLHQVEGKYTFCMLHQALLTLTVLEASIKKAPERFLTPPFWETILDNNDLQNFKGLAIRGLGYIDWRLALKKLPLFIDELLEKSGQEHPDDLMFGLAAALKFIFERLNFDRESLPISESQYIGYFMEMMAKCLEVYRYKPQITKVLELTEKAFEYLDDKNEFTGKRMLKKQTADLIHSLSSAVINNTTVSLVSFEDKQEYREADSLNIDYWYNVRQEIKQPKVAVIMGCA